MIRKPRRAPRIPPWEAEGAPPEVPSGAAAAAPWIGERLAELRRAQQRWAALPPAGRLAVVARLRRLLAAAALAPPAGSGRGEWDLAARVDRASRAETLSAEVLPLAEALAFLERQAEAILAPRRPGAAGRPVWLRGVDLEVRREPLGVVLVIGPSNYPLFLPAVQAAQALTAGNGVVWKPGRGGAAVARVFASMLVQAGLDPRLLLVLPEDPEAGRAAAAGVDKVVLTGSAATGRAVLADLAPRLTPATMELSGCDPVFVREDADLPRVVDALVFGLRWNGGATCIAPRRVFVHRSRADELERRLTPRVAALPPVPVSAAATAAATAETAARARRLASDAVASEARLLAGSLDEEAAGELFSPLLLADVPPGCEILRQDLFAPVLSLIPVAGDEEALELDRGCPYALGAAIFGSERGARRLAERVRAGVVVVNDVIVPTADPRLPFGGRGASGFGVTRGAEGLLELTAPKAVAVRSRRRGRLRHLEAPQAGDESLFRAFLGLAHGDLRTRLRGAVALVRALVRRRAPESSF